MKRERERMDDDDPDIMPLSKRMNNIHFGGVANPGGGGGSYVPGSASSSNINGFVNGRRENLEGLVPQMFQQPVPASANSEFCNNHLNANMSSNAGEGNTSSRMDDPSSCDNRLMQGVQYNPVLSRDQNPIYYDQNRMLFELYKERLSRVGQSNFPHS